MRKVLIVLVVALALVPAASAKNPHDQTEPSPSVPTVVSGPARLAPGLVPSVDGTAPAPAGTATTASSGCGACIVQCWGTVTRNGPSDWSGHVWIYHRINWCGNGAQITSVLGAAQSFDQSGWYTLQGQFGPWWTSGCVGCGSLTMAGYMTWSWTAQLIGITHTGTTYLNTTLTAYGGVSAS